MSEARKRFERVMFHSAVRLDLLTQSIVFTTGGLPPLVKHPDQIYKYLFSKLAYLDDCIRLTSIRKGRREEQSLL